MRKQPLNLIMVFLRFFSLIPAIAGAYLNFLMISLMDSMSQGMTDKSLFKYHVKPCREIASDQFRMSYPPLAFKADNTQELVKWYVFVRVCVCACINPE